MRTQPNCRPRCRARAREAFRAARAVASGVATATSPTRPRSLLARARARASCAVAQLGVARGDRVLLCYLPGIEFVAAGWACLRVGAIAVPVSGDPNKLAMGVKKLGLVRAS